MSLTTDIQQVVEKSGVSMGIALRHIESGEEILLNADSYYPLASVVKVPLLVEACCQMAAGTFRPTDRWTLSVVDKNLPSGILLFLDDGLTPTVKDILTLMIIISDNTATDIVLKRLTKEAVNRRMRSLGLEHTHVTLTIRELFEQVIPNADPTQDLYELDRQSIAMGSPRDSLAYRLTPENNVATARDLTSLFCQIYAGSTPDRQWSDFALKILLQQQLNDRLPRLLPAGTRCAHKTGTITGVRNDSGILYAGDASHVAITVFSSWDEITVEKDPRASRACGSAIDLAIGEIGLLAFEAFR
jgi:beta-lactamase class A